MTHQQTTNQKIVDFLRENFAGKDITTNFVESNFKVSRQIAEATAIVIKMAFGPEQHPNQVCATLPTEAREIILGRIRSRRYDERRQTLSPEAVAKLQAARMRLEEFAPETDAEIVNLLIERELDKFIERYRLEKQAESGGHVQCPHCDARLPKATLPAHLHLRHGVMSH